MAARLTLGNMRRELIRAAFCEFFGIGETRAELLIVLWERQGEPAPLSWLGLCKAVNRHRPPSVHAVEESLRVLRSCMEAESIDREGAAYFLTEVGRAECATALKFMGRELIDLASAPRAEEGPARGTIGAA